MFSLVELFSYADIIYLELDSLENSDIVYLENGEVIKGRVVEQSPEQVKIKTSQSLLPPSYIAARKNIFVYGAEEVEKVEIRLAKKKTSTLSKIAKGCIWGYIGISLFFCLKNGGSKVAKNNNQRF